MERTTMTLLGHPTEVGAAVFTVAVRPDLRGEQGDGLHGKGFKLHSIKSNGLDVRSAHLLIGSPFTARLRDHELIQSKGIETARSDWDHRAARPGPLTPIATPAQPPPH